MRLHIAVLTAALALAAGCDRGADNRARSDTPPAQPQASTPSTPANIGQPKSLEERREGANPVQGQVDPKQSEQHQDFKQPGAAAGPTSPETQPRGDR